MSSEWQKEWKWRRQAVLSRRLALLVRGRNWATAEIGQVEYGLRRRTSRMGETGACTNVSRKNPFERDWREGAS